MGTGKTSFLLFMINFLNFLTINFSLCLRYATKIFSYKDNTRNQYKVRKSLHTLIFVKIFGVLYCIMTKTYGEDVNFSENFSLFVMNF